MLRSVMINHSTKSPLRTHKDMSPGAKQLLCAWCWWFTARPGGCIQPDCQLLNRKTLRRCQTDKESAAPVKSCTVDTSRRWRRGSPLPLSVGIMAIRSVTCSINQADGWFVYPLGVWRGLKQQYLSPPAVPSEANLGFPTFSLFIPLLHCSHHNEFGAELYLGALLLLFPLSFPISVSDSCLCVLSFIQQMSAFTDLFSGGALRNDFFQSHSWR